MEAEADELDRCAEFFSNLLAQYSKHDPKSETQLGKFLKLVHRICKYYFELDVPPTKTVRSLKHWYDELPEQYQKFIDNVKNDPDAMNALMAKTGRFLEENEVKLQPLTGGRRYYYIVRVCKVYELHDFLPRVGLFDSYECALTYAQTIDPKFSFSKDAAIASSKVENGSRIVVLKCAMNDTFFGF